MKSSKTSIVLQYVALIFLVIVVTFPLLWMVLSSIKPSWDLFSSPVRILPQAVTFEWYELVLRRAQTIRMFINSFLIALATMALNMIIAALAAHSVSRFRYKGRGVVMFAALSSYVFPPIVLLVPLYVVMNQFGLIGTQWSAVLTHTLLTLPFSLWMLRTFFNRIPVEIDEAASIDGVGPLKTFWYIILPLAAPGVFSVGLLAFIVSWSEYLFSSTFLRGEENKTLPVGISEYVTGFDVRWGEIMALGTVTTVPIIIFFFLIQRYFVAGMTAGGLKE